MKLSVMIPTFRRGESLSRCFRGLSEQTRPADQILVIFRPEDEETLKVVEEWSRILVLTPVAIDRPGQVQALNRGLEEVTGNIVAITDDDTFPHAEWLARIERHFLSDSSVGGVGGRDAVYVDGRSLAHPPSEQVVGRILSFGRIVGNHHIGLGGVREVDTLKGANMSWRMAAVGASRFETDLRGAGAQVRNDMGFSLMIKSKGWRLLYDPEVLVDHYPAPRFDSDQRKAPSLDAMENAAFNLYLLLRRYAGSKKRAALAWAYFIGTRNEPGVVRGLVSSMKRDQAGMLHRQAAVRAWRDAKAAEMQRLAKD